MTIMKLTRNYHVPFHDVGSYIIAVVGVGGTGSHVSYDMARLISHGRSQGVQIEMVLIDPDNVEEKNVGRQRFTRAEIGMNKAHARAASLSRWLGIEVRFVAERFGSDLLRKTRLAGQTKQAILLGCLDDSFGNEGRQQLAMALAGTNKNVIWIDAGNDRYSGQVAVGNVAAGKSIRVNKALGFASGLPAPHVSIPGLLDAPEAAEEGDASCAELTAAGEQSLFINSTMAGIMSQYVFDIVFRKRLEAMATFVNLSPVTTQSVMINDDSLAKYSRGIEIKE